MMARVKAPRNVFINFPLGHNCGKPLQVDLQKSILKDTLNVLLTAKNPGEVVDLPYEWESDFNWETYQQDMQAMIEEEGITAQEWKPKA